MSSRSSASCLRRCSPLIGLFAAATVLALSIGCARREQGGAGAPLWSMPAGSTRLHAAARFTGTQLVVDNQGSDIWRDVTIMVGRASDPPAYLYRADAVLGGRSLAVGALNFERPDGTRWSPFHTQPDRWAITARLPDGRGGFAEGTLR